MKNVVNNVHPLLLLLLTPFSRYAVLSPITLP